MGSSKKSITRKNRNDKKRSKKGQRERKSRDNQNNIEKDLEKGEKKRQKKISQNTTIRTRKWLLRTYQNIYKGRRKEKVDSLRQQGTNVEMNW